MQTNYLNNNYFFNFLRIYCRILYIFLLFIPHLCVSQSSTFIGVDINKELTTEGVNDVRVKTFIKKGFDNEYWLPNYFCENDSIFYNLSAEKFINIYILEYRKGYDTLDIPDFTYDYVTYFNNIPDIKKLKRQYDFFTQQLNRLILNKKEFDTNKCSNEVIFDHLYYEIKFNLERVLLEIDWVNNERVIPVNGIYKLKNRKKWYRHFSQKFTSLKLSPQEISKFGKRVVKRQSSYIDSIRLKMGFADIFEFYKFLNADTFLYHSNTEIENAFIKLGRILSEKSDELFGCLVTDPIEISEWPNSDSLTAPGRIVINSVSGKNVFYYNFYNSSFNKRMIDWLYLHEVMPGHNLQYSFLKQVKKDSLQDICFYPGNIEGWACYVENFGKYLGAYNNDFTYIGKCEWDLIRGIRIVIDYGIHYKGWSKKKALNYWNKYIKEQDNVAIKEINRIISWPGQSLSYQIGSNFITTLKTEIFDRNSVSNPTDSKFHKCFIEFGMRPLEVIKKDFEKKFNEYNN